MEVFDQSCLFDLGGLSGLLFVHRTGFTGGLLPCVHLLLKKIFIMLVQSFDLQLLSQVFSFDCLQVCKTSLQILRYFCVEQTNIGSSL